MKKNSESTAAAPAKEKSKPKELTKVDNLKRELIRLSDLNPRKTFDEEAIKELAISIDEQGLLQPITVRPIPNLLTNKMEQIYEIVCGARRFKALSLLEAKTIPCIIRELTDAEALDAMITENLQRKDVDPLEEAEAFKILTQQGQSVNELSVRFGKSENYIRGRMILNDLVPSVAQALHEDRIPLTAAVKVAKFKTNQQEEFFKTYLKPTSSNDEQRQASISDVNSYLRRISASLARAIFLDNMKEDWNDKKHPHCINCPCNSASQQGLFPEMAKEAQCSNPECFKKKLYAYQDWLLSFFWPNFILKGNEPQAGEITITKGWGWCEDKKRLEQLVNKVEKAGLAILNKDKYERTYQEKINTSKYIRCLDLTALVEGHAPWIYLVPKTNEVKKEQTRWDVSNSLTNLRDRRDKLIQEKLEPFITENFAAFTDDLKRQDIQIPKALTGIIVAALHDCMSYLMTNELKLSYRGAIPELITWTEKHSLSELIVLTARDIIDNSSHSHKDPLIRFLCETLAPDATNVLIKPIIDKIAPKEAALETKLKEFDEKDSKNQRN